LAFAKANGRKPGSCIGENYIKLCDNSAPFALEAKPMAEGIRAVLSGEESQFQLDYPCDSPNEKRWFRAVVTPLGQDPRNGAVITHINITAQRQAEISR